MNLQAIEDAIHQWLVSASGFPGGLVILGDQNAPQPVIDFIEYRIGDSTPVGQDAIARDYNAGRPAGQEVGLTTTGMRELVVSVEARTAARTGNNSARAVLEACRTALGRPSIRGTLNDAGLAPLGTGEGVQNLSALLEKGASFEGRGLLEVRFYVEETSVEYEGYIATCLPAGTYEEGATVSVGTPAYQIGFTKAHTNGIEPVWGTSFNDSSTLDLFIAFRIRDHLTGVHSLTLEVDLPPAFGGGVYQSFDLTFATDTTATGTQQQAEAVSRGWRVWADMEIQGSILEEMSLYGLYTVRALLDGVQVAATTVTISP